MFHSKNFKIMICIIDNENNKNIMNRISRVSPITSEEVKNRLEAVSILLEKAREAVEEMEEGLGRNIDQAGSQFEEAMDKADAEAMQHEAYKFAMSTRSKEQMKALMGRITDAIESAKNVSIRLA